MPANLMVSACWVSKVSPSITPATETVWVVGSGDGFGVEVDNLVNNQALVAKDRANKAIKDVFRKFELRDTMNKFNRLMN